MEYRGDPFVKSVYCNSMRKQILLCGYIPSLYRRSTMDYSLGMLLSKWLQRRNRLKSLLRTSDVISGMTRGRKRWRICRTTKHGQYQLMASSASSNNTSNVSFSEREKNAIMSFLEKLNNGETKYENLDPDGLIVELMQVKALMFICQFTSKDN